MCSHLKSELFVKRTRVENVLSILLKNVRSALIRIHQKRKLGVAEKVIWLIDKEISFNFLTYGKICGYISDSHLRKSIEIVQSRHPLLKARIEKKYFSGAYFEFTDVPSIPIRIISSPENTWIQQAEYELQKPFPLERGPLCRCVLIRHNDSTQTLMLIFHHAIGDAMSGVYMTRDLIHTLSHLINNNDPFLPPLPLKQSMENYFPIRTKNFYGMPNHLNFLLYLILNRMRFGKPYVPEQESWAPPSQRTPLIINRSLSADFVINLIRSARKKQTTVHGILSAAYILAMVEDGKLHNSYPFFLGTDINLRKYLKPVIGEDVGFFITGIFTQHHAGPSSGFWELTHNIRASINERIINGDHFTGVHRLIRVTNFIYRFLGTGRLASRIYANHIDKTNPGMIVMSNIGDVSFKEDFAPFKIHTIGFASSFSSTATLGLHVATFNGFLTMNFVAMKPLYRNKKIKHIADRMIEILKQQVNQALNY